MRLFFYGKLHIVWAIVHEINLWEQKCFFGIHWGYVLYWRMYVNSVWLVCWR